MPLVIGNSIRLLKDAQENYPAWIEAIGAAKQRIYFESYIIHEDDTGRMFAEALVRKAQEGVRVRLIYDWLGGCGTASRAFWNRLRAGGVDVRCYNPAHSSIKAGSCAVPRRTEPPCPLKCMATQRLPGLFSHSHLQFRISGMSRPFLSM